MRAAPRIHKAVWSLPSLFSGAGSQRSHTGGEKSIMVNDTISDFLARIKNGYLAKKDFVKAPYAKILKEIADIMQKNNYLEKVEVENISLDSKSGQKRKKAKKEIKAYLKYQDGKAKIENIQRVSRPGVRIYVKKDKIPYVLNGYGIAIVSSSKGLITDRQARKQKLGGELICKIW